MLMNLDELTVTSAAAAIRDGNLTASELMSMVLERARETEPIVHAYVSLDEQAAMEAAEAADGRRLHGTPCGPLHGIPIGVKDLIATADFPTQAGSAVLSGYRPQSDAVAVRKLRAAGALIIGKHYAHEFGFGMDEPPTRSLWDLNRYAGGSSVGGGVSVAVGSSLAALGTDGGGSIRKPASITGVVGLKPTYGMVDTEGIIPGTTSFDHVGWITRSVADSGLLLDVLTESTTPPETSVQGVSGLRIGCPDYFFRDLEPDIEEQVQSCLEALAYAGAIIVPLDLPELELSPLIHSTLGAAESYQLHKKWVQRTPEKYHRGSLSFLEGGAHVAQDELTLACRRRGDLQKAMESVFAHYRLNAICSPTVALAPVPLSQMDPERMLPYYIKLTAPFNITGQPALSVPCGLGSAGLPVGLQITARAGDEEMILRIGEAAEETGVWTQERLAAASHIRHVTG